MKKFQQFHELIGNNTNLCKFDLSSVEGYVFIQKTITRIIFRSGHTMLIAIEYDVFDATINRFNEENPLDKFNAMIYELQDQLLPIAKQYMSKMAERTQEELNQTDPIFKLGQSVKVRLIKMVDIGKTVYKFITATIEHLHYQNGKWWYITDFNNSSIPEAELVKWNKPEPPSTKKDIVN